MSKYHTIFSMSVKDCQQMLMSNDYMMICNGSRPLIKARAKKAYSKFIEQLQGLFGGEKELIEAIGKDTLIMSMKLRMDVLASIKDDLLRCYDIQDNVKGKIEAYDKTKALYRKVFFDYPKPVDANAEKAIREKQINAVIKPIESEILRLKYKIKERQPKQGEKPKGDDRFSGLELHILFIQQVNPEMGYLDRNMNVDSLSKAYELAVKKNAKSKIKE